MLLGDLTSHALNMLQEHDAWMNRDELADAIGLSHIPPYHLRLINQ